MTAEGPGRARVVLGPTGNPMTLEDLPPTNIQRWVARRKAELLAAIRGGLITQDEACKRYLLTPEELTSWERLIDKHGMLGLRTTRLQHYRSSLEAPSEEA